MFTVLSLNVKLTPGGTVLLEKLTFTQIANKFPAFIEPKYTIPYSQGHATGPYPKPDESSPHLPTLFPQDPF
jgi:hypothetical protein